MILTIAAPKGGVGSSTFALLLAREMAAASPVLLVDAAGDPSLDLYTASEHLLASAFNGQLDAATVALENLQGLCLARVEPDQLVQLDFTKETFWSHEMVIIDLGVPGEAALAFLKRASTRLIVVLTQDNQVLRAGDRLLGIFREGEIACEFIISQMEAKDPSQLADLDDIFNLLEEDFDGTIAFDPTLRVAMNQGRCQDVSQEIWTDVQKIIEVIRQREDDAAAEGSESPPDLDLAKTDDAKGDSEESLTEESHEISTAQPSGESTPGVSTDQVGDPSVLSRIRRFFQNFGKGI